jgi:hypothetical protein
VDVRSEPVTVNVPAPNVVVNVEAAAPPVVNVEPRLQAPDVYVTVEAAEPPVVNVTNTVERNATVAFTRDPQGELKGALIASHD